MNSLLIKNGKVISPVNGYRGEVLDILIKDGRIAQIGSVSEECEQVLDASGCLVTPGFIDIHTHCYPDTFLGLDPDVLGIQRGATTILDAGSSGADNYEDFRKRYIDTADTKVFTLLNLSKEGLIRGHELDSPEKVDITALKEVVERYCDNIVGLKARASASVVGEMGLAPIALAAKVAKETGKPLTVHVGNYPPALTEVLGLLEKDDIVTHAYHGKKGGILTEEGHIIPEAIEARARGVLFDVGHGVASFSFKVFQKALAEGFDCDMISTDLHQENYNGPVYNLAAVASKLVNCKETLQDAITKCTSVPAQHYGLKHLGELREGAIADVNIMEWKICQKTVSDSIGDTIQLEHELVLKNTVYSRGKNSEIFRHNIEE